MTTDAAFGEEARSRVEAMPDREVVGYLVYRFDATMPEGRSRGDYLNLADQILAELADRSASQ